MIFSMASKTHFFSLSLSHENQSAQPVDVRVPVLGDRAVQPDARAEYRRAGAEVRAGWRERKREREGSGFFFVVRSTIDLSSSKPSSRPRPLLSRFPPSLYSFASPRIRTILRPRLEDLGHGVGASLLELLCWRERGGKRMPHGPGRFEICALVAVEGAVRAAGEGSGAEQHGE